MGDCTWPKRGSQVHVAQAEVDDEPALFLMHRSVELHSSPVPVDTTSTASMLLHINEPRAHAFLGSCSNDNRMDRWYLDTVATQNMTGWHEYVTDLDSTIRGTIKFGDASDVEIAGVDSILVAKTGECRLLTSIYYIPALRNSTISLGSLDENSSRVQIKHGVLRIWD